MHDVARCLEAIDLALGHDWNRAHAIVQDLPGKVPAWVHAVLHRIEGDLGNSHYWYQRAGRPFSNSEPKDELLQIKAILELGVGETSEQE